MPAAEQPGKGVTKTLRIPGRNDLLLHCPDGWDMAIEQSGGGPLIFVRHLGSKDTGLSITVLPGDRPGKPVPVERAREVLEARAKRLLPQLKEATLEYKEIKGESSAGYYCLITYKKPEKGRGPHGTLATVAVGDMLLTCEVAQKFETGPWQKLALDILRTAYQKPADKPATAPTSQPKQ
jgi:hypothetical protein